MDRVYELTFSPKPRSIAVKTPPPSRSATFKRSIPCFFVSHIPTALPWYEEVLGFKVVGKADAGRAELHRAAPGSSPKTTGQGSVDGVSIYLRRHLDAESAPPKGSLWIEVDKVDGEQSDHSSHADESSLVDLPPHLLPCSHPQPQTSTRRSRTSLRSTLRALITTSRRVILVRPRSRPSLETAASAREP